MTNKNQMQQGDVLFRRVINYSNNAQGLRGRHVLAEGEHTGHAHVIDDAELIREGECMLVRVLGGGATVTHQEHGPITLPDGVWEVGRVREVDHLSGLVRQVQD